MPTETPPPNDTHAAEQDSLQTAVRLLERERGFLKTLIGTLPDLIWLKDPDGVYLACNPAFERFFGADEADIAGRTDYDFVDKSLADFFREHDRRAMAADRPTVNDEWITFARGGQRVLLETTKTPMRDSHGNLVGILGIGHDITQRHEDAERIRASEEKLRGLYELSPLGIALTDMNGRFMQFNAAFAAICGYPATELSALDYWTLTPNEYMADEARQLESLSTTGRYGPYEKEYQRKDGTRVPVGLNGRRITGADGEPCIWSIVEDITERKRVERELRQAAGVFHYANEGIMVTAVDGTILDVNATFTRITGYERGEVLGKTPRILRSGRHDAAFFAGMWRSLETTGHWSGEIWNRRKNGEVFPEAETISAICDEHGAVQRYVALFSDITAQKDHEHQLEYIAHYDALTRLPNRVLLADRLHQAMALGLRRDSLVVVAFLDLDGFKAVNDMHGHDVGDRLLVALAQRMKGVLREGDTLARLGGDEFVAVLPDVASIASCEPILARLLRAAAEPVTLDKKSLQVSASIGVAAFPQASDVDADQLMRQADQAMYYAKQTGKNRYHVFDASQDQQVRQRHETIERVREALDQGELRLYYQPKVNLRTGKTVGVEALIRWQHPERGLLAPAEFLPHIENDDMIVRVGEWTIATALRQMAAWQAQRLSVRVSVNVASRQLQAADFPEMLQATLSRYPEVARMLELEILESSAIDDIAQVSEQMHRCKAVGVEFAIDDFGTGYSSLAYLKRLPSRALKIDQSFVRGMLAEPEDLAILEGVLGLAVAFELDAIAEGVETAAHCEMLQRLGCDLAQGYAIARPMPASELPVWMHGWPAVPPWRRPPRLDREHRRVLLALVEHRAWVDQLGSYLRGDNGAPQPPTARECRFSGRLFRDGLVSLGAHPAVARIVTLHDELHGKAATLMRLKQAGNVAAALAGLAAIETLRETVVSQLEALIDAHGRPAAITATMADTPPANT